ncbi:MAG: rRNA pseudouridine synthase [Oscillospiraceae bacterium]|jgi:16S rRNA pseudouridine516 synthase|nr:rRNA pseudouridine synthase [Oscillospiraceae bacterium]
MLRLDKMLADAGWGTRNEVRQAIRTGRVRVDGDPVSDPARKVDPSACAVLMDGQEIGYRAHDYLMMHKPAGVVSATEDPREPTVIDLLPPPYRRRGLFPAGRLDKDATGLLVLTNDGALAHRITAPGRRVPRVYRVEVDGPLSPADAEAFAAGMTLPGGEVCLSAELCQIPGEEGKTAQVTLCEGKYHQIKRMFAARGHTVLALKRLSHGALRLDETLRPGEWRPLSEAERAALDGLR